MIGFRKSTYWMGIGSLLIVFFSFTGTPLIQTVYFISFLMPVIIFSSYYFNHRLIPQYLLTGKYLLFSSYTIYTIVIALYAQAIILFCSLLLFSNFQIGQINTLGIDILSLGLGTLLVILVNAFYNTVISLSQQQKVISDMKKELKLTELSTITIKANRRNYQVSLEELMIIESRGDYVQLFTDTETIITKEKISSLEANLPKQFIRTHRSYLVNKNRIQSYNKNMIHIGSREIPISRTYKNTVLQLLNQRDKNSDS